MAKKADALDQAGNFSQSVSILRSVIKKRIKGSVWPITAIRKETVCESIYLQKERVFRPCEVSEERHLGHIVFGSNGHRMATTTVLKCRSAELKFRVPLVIRRPRGKMVPKRSLTNFGSTAGETSSADSRNLPLQENLSVKVFLESCNPY